MRISNLLSFDPVSIMAFAVLPLRTIMCAIVMGVTCLASVTNPICGVVLYVMVYQITPNTRWWGSPLSDMGIRFSMLAGLFTIIGMIVSPHRVPKVRPWLSAWEIGLIALVGIGLANNYVFGLPTTPAGVAAFDKFWKMMLFVLILNRMASSRENLRIMLWAFLVGSLYLGYEAWTAPRWAFVQGRLSMMGGPDFQTSSSFSAHMTAMLPLIGVAFLIAKNWKWRVLAVLSGAFSINAVFMCRTRSAFIGLLAGVAIAFVTAPRTRRFRIYVLLILGGLCAFSLTDDFFWKRMATMNRSVVETDVAAQQRLQVWKASMKLIGDYPYGIGMANFPRLIGRYDNRHYNRGSHNTLIICFSELGVQGGLVFTIMVALTAMTLWRCSKSAHLSDDPLETKFLIYGVIVSWTTYFVAGLGTERLYSESYWWVFAMPHWIDRMITREAEQRLPALATEEESPLDQPDALAAPGVS